MAMSEVISPPITLRRGEVDAIVGEVLGGASYGEGEQITPPPTAEGPIKPPEHPRDGDGRFGISTVWIDHRFHLVGFDDFLISCRVKSGIQGSS